MAENLRVDVANKTLYSSDKSSNWSTYLVGATIALVLGVGVYTIGKNAPNMANSALNSVTKFR